MWRLSGRKQLCETERDKCGAYVALKCAAHGVVWGSCNQKQVACTLHLVSAHGCTLIAFGVNTCLRKLANEGRCRECRAQNPHSSQSDNAHDKNGARRALYSLGQGAGGAEQDHAFKVSCSSGSTTTTTTVWTGIASCYLTSCLTLLLPDTRLCCLHVSMLDEDTRVSM